MHLESISLIDFRNYESVGLEFPDSGLVVLKGNNGHGKTNLLEAISYLASSKSFRETTSDTLVRSEAESAVLRGTGFNLDRELLIEAEINRTGRNRVRVNRQAIRHRRSLDETLAVTTFSPGDLDLVKAGPGVRRTYIDDLLAGTDERRHRLQSDFERILKQRNALVRQSGGRCTPEVLATLDVWDERMAETGEQIGEVRSQLVGALQPAVESAYREISGGLSARIGMSMTTEWRRVDGGQGLRLALEATRHVDLARGVTTVGPHRDELHLSIRGLPARNQASQGEQRSLAIGLRLAAHRHVEQARGSSPILLLDDVFSELDDRRTERLLNSLPNTQCLLATAVDIPANIEPELEITILDGAIR